MDYTHSPIFWLIILLYCLVIIGVGIYFSKFVRSADDFFGASRTTPWWAAGLSYFMTAFSATVFIASASFTYRFGGLSVASVVLAVFVFIASYFWLSKRWHRTGCDTAIEFIEQRFGKLSAKFFVATGIPIRILDNAIRIYVTGVLMSTILGFELWVGVIATTVIAFISSIAGGFLSVIATDALQAFVLGIITILIAVFSLILVGGPSELLARLPDGFWSLNPPGEYDMLFISALALMGIFSWNGYWSLVQRYVSVPTERDAQLVALTSGVSYYLLFPLFTLPPIIAAVLVPGLTGAVETEQSYLLLAKMILPAGMLGIFFFALLGAAVTSLNSEFNVIAQVVVENVIRPIRPAFAKRHGLLLGRLLMGVVALACLLFSLLIPKMGGAYHFLVTVMGMTTLPTFVPLLFGLFDRRTPGWGAILAFCVGVLVSLIMGFVLKVPLGWIILANFAVTLLILFVSGRVSPASEHPSVVALFKRFATAPVEPKEAVPTVRPRAKSPMASVLGWSMFILAAISSLAYIGPAESQQPTTWMVASLVTGGIILLAINRLRSAS